MKSCVLRVSFSITYDSLIYSNLNSLDIYQGKYYFFSIFKTNVTEFFNYLNDLKKIEHLKYSIGTTKIHIQLQSRRKGISLDTKITTKLKAIKDFVPTRK